MSENNVSKRRHDLGHTMMMSRLIPVLSHACELHCDCAWTCRITDVASRILSLIYISPRLFQRDGHLDRSLWIERARLTGVLAHMWICEWIDLSLEYKHFEIWATKNSK